MFGPQVLETITSPINGNLEVRRLGKDAYVTCGGLTQSGGLINQLWEKTLKKIANDQQIKNSSWLILGLATGTVAKLISQKYSPLKIVGVEIDPLMLRVGRKYFGLDQTPHLEIVHRDALNYVLRATGKFDFVLVDLYLGDQLPQFVYTPKFIRAVKRIGRVAVFNHLFYDQDKKTNARLLTDRLAKIFPHILLVRELTNLLIVCS